jgi:hypothetical protein
MLRVFPWILSVVLLAAFVASFSELGRVRKRFGEVTRHVFHDHADVRLSVIRSAMAQERSPIVVIGDSVAERARFPAVLCGRPVVNAAIGGASLEELTRLAKEINAASLVVIIAGTNNAGTGIEAPYTQLLNAVRPPKIAIAATFSTEVNRAIIDASKRAMVAALDLPFSEFDDVHPTPDAYRLWMPRLVEAISEECAR